MFLGETGFHQMEIKIGDVKRAYVSRDGDVSIRSLVFMIKLYDPTSMTPNLHNERWRVYTPYDIKVWMDPGMVIKFNLGLGFRVPEGFILYMFTNSALEGQIETDGLFITPGDKEDVEVTVRCIKSFYLRKYMHIANFIILPVINTQDTRGLMCVPFSNEYR